MDKEHKKKIFQLIVRNDVNGITNYLALNPSLNLNEAVSSKGSSLIVAAEQGKYDIVQFLLGLDNDPLDRDSIGDDGYTALNFASNNGHFKIVQLLINEGAGLNICSTSRNRSPLYSACAEKHTDIAKLLINAGADIGIKSVSGNSPFDLAVPFGLDDVVELLLDRAIQIASRSPNWEPSLKRSNPKEYTQLLAKAGVDINNKPKDSGSPLNYACYSGNFKIASRLVEEGADIDSVDEVKFTSLNHACRKGHLDIVKLLISAGANLNLPDSDDDTPLNNACRKGRMAVVKVLLDASAEIEKPNSSGLTPLNSAAARGHADIVSLLIDAGANIYTKDGDDDTPLANAVNQGHESVVKIIRDAMESKQFPLHEACRKGDLLTVRQLIEDGSKVSEKTNKKLATPLHCACETGRIEVVEYLISRKADSTARDADGNTPLAAAVIFKKFDVMRLLVTAGADVACLYTGDKSCFFGAAKSGDLENMEVLVGLGVPVDASDSSNQTALYLACVDNRANIVQYLLSKGANMNIQSISRGWTALIFACANGRTEIAKMLIEAGADWKLPSHSGSLPIHAASSHGHTEIVSALAKVGADLSAKAGDGDLPIHTAACQGYEKMLSLLVRFGVDVNAVDGSGNTPLITASRNISAECVKCLISAGAIVNFANTMDGVTALHKAVTKKQLKVVEALCEAGADKTARNGHGDTPLHLAAKALELPILEYLLSGCTAVNIINSEGQTVLFMATIYDEEGEEEGEEEGRGDEAEEEEELVRSLRPEDKKGNGNVGLRMLRCVRVLVEAGSDLSILDNDQVSVVNSAAYFGHATVVEYLIERGADFQTPSLRSNTPLANASRKGHHDVVRVLLKSGADHCVVNSDDKTALELAVEGELLQVIAVFIEEGAVAGDDALPLACKVGDVKLVRKCIRSVTGDWSKVICVSDWIDRYISETAKSPCLRCDKCKMPVRLQPAGFSSGWTCDHSGHTGSNIFPANGPKHPLYGCPTAKACSWCVCQACWDAFSPKNRAGLSISLGTGSNSTTYYCGRKLGTDVIPGSDGQCGPSNGPQCPDCQGITNRSALMVKNSVIDKDLTNGEGITLSSNDTEVKFLNGPATIFSLDVANDGEPVISWSFSVSGNDSWCMGLVPMSSVSDPSYLHHKGQVGLDSRGTAGGQLPKASMHGKVIGFVVDKRAMKAQAYFDGSLHREWTLDSSHFPCKLGVCGFAGTVAKFIDDSNPAPGGLLAKAGVGEDLLGVGSKVEARYKGRGTFYSGVIALKHGNDTYDIDYNDGDKEKGVARNLIRLPRDGTGKNRFDNGDGDEEVEDGVVREGRSGDKSDDKIAILQTFIELGFDVVSLLDKDRHRADAVERLQLYQSSYQKYPIHCAIRQGQLSENNVAEMLEQYGDSVCDVDYKGRTAFSAALKAQSSFPMMAAVLDHLLRVKQECSKPLLEIGRGLHARQSLPLKEFPDITFQLDTQPSLASKLYFECTIIEGDRFKIGVSSSKWSPTTESDQSEFLGFSNKDLTRNVDRVSGRDSGFKSPAYPESSPMVNNAASIATHMSRGGARTTARFQYGSKTPGVLVDDAQESTKVVGLFDVYGICVNLSTKEVSAVRNGDAVLTWKLWSGQDDAVKPVIQMLSKNGKFLLNFGENPDHPLQHMPRDYVSYFTAGGHFFPRYIRFWNRKQWETVRPEHGLLRQYLFDWSDLFKSSDQLPVVKGILQSVNTLEKIHGFVDDTDEQGRDILRTCTGPYSYLLRSYVYFMGRYEYTSKLPEHKSPTCTVMIAKDTAKKNALVAIKLMKLKENYLRELNNRRGMDARYVVQVAKKFDGDEDAEFRLELEQKSLALYNYCIIMPAANRNLQQILLQEDVAGKDMRAVRRMMQELTSCLLQVHECGIIHADLKPLNVMRTAEGSLVLIDFDASTKFGDAVGVKCSSAFCPPEMVHSAIVEGSDDRMFVILDAKARRLYNVSALFAAPAFDLWSLGVIFFHMCTGEPLFLSSYDNLDEQGLRVLFEWSNEQKNSRLLKVEDPKARNLLSRLLSKNPKSRPSLQAVLAHPFVSDRKALRMVGDSPKFDVFLSYRVSSDSERAEQLYKLLTAAHLTVWWDRKCIVTGDNWEEAFCNGLVQSKVFVCLISEDAIAPFSRLTETSGCDNVLLELQMALELHAMGMLEAIQPILIGRKSSAVTNQYDRFDFASSAKPPDLVVRKVADKVAEHLDKHALGSPIEPQRTVLKTKSDVFMLQALFIEGEGGEAFRRASEEVCDRCAGLATSSTVSSPRSTVTARPMAALRKENELLTLAAEELRNREKAKAGEIEKLKDLIARLTGEKEALADKVEALSRNVHNVTLVDLDSSIDTSTDGVFDPLNTTFP